jgi:Flp pilus assembly protein TadD
MSSHRVFRKASQYSATLLSEQAWRDFSMHQSTMYLQPRILLAFAALATAMTSVVAAQNERTPNNLTAAEVAQVVDRIQAPVVSEKDLMDAMNASRILLRAGRYGEAAKLLTAIAAKKPNDFEVRYAQALATFNAGRVAEAETLVRRAVDLARSAATLSNTDRIQSTADALVLLGVVLAVKGDDAAALRAVQEAARMAPNHFDAQLALGRALFGMGDDSGAAKAFKAAKTLQPTNPQALFFLATALEHSGEIAEALATYRELVALKPDMSEGHLGLGALLMKGNPVNSDEGLKELERALQLNPNLYEGHVAAGRALIAKGRPLDAIAHLQRAAELAPNNPEPHYQLYIAYRRLGRKQEAADEAAIVKRIHESRRGKSVSQSRVEQNNY